MNNVQGSTKTQLYFVRHAQPNYENHDDKSRELTPKGWADRQRVAALLRDKGISAVYASDFKRAIDTVSALAEELGLPVETDPDFRERKVGDMWLEDFDSYAQRQWADFDYALPHGESLAQTQRRNVAALQRLLEKHPGQSVAIGSHGTALSTVIHYYDRSFGYAEFERIRDLMPWVVEFTFEGLTCRSIQPHNLFEIYAAPQAE